VARLAAALLIALLVTGAPAAAQSTSRPGPWALDVRGVTSPVPEQTVFYPTLDRTALIPGRGFGFDLGVHLYLLNLGAARLGIGADLFYVRGKTTPLVPTPAAGSGTTASSVGQAVEVDLRMLAPQVSFNFGSREGWSYLSAGLGTADVVTRTAGVLPGRRQQSSRLNALNVGGGARWFVKSHLAVGFDIRMHNIGAGTVEAPAPLVATPSMRILTVAVGLSIK
jgi:opacity protein-like surface antigen